jgi:H+/Cl- antiporter ClcA
MKSILSGVTLNKYLSPQTFVAKFLGLITCMSSGMIVGRAGPFVRILTPHQVPPTRPLRILDASLTQLPDFLFKPPDIASIVANQVAKMRMFTRIEKNASLKNHMLAAACGIGMSGSHGAAFGGVLFSIEVTSTYYPIRNYWYSFIGAFVAAITFRIGWNSFVGRSIFKPFLPTKFHVEADPSAFDWLTFIMLGVLCGCLSLLYVNVNEAIVKFRRTYDSKYKILGPFPYAVLVGFCSALLTFPGFFGTFVSNGNVATIMDLIQDRPLNGYGFLNADWAVYSKYYSLTVIVLVRFILQTIVVSVPAPIGVFSPLMALGACFGRLIGEVLRDIFPMGTIPPAAYAIAGAAATVGGVTHVRHMVSSAN